MKLLELRNLSVTRRKRRVLEDVSLSVGEGELVGLIGPNGAGKSTLMEAALGMIPFSGTSDLAESGIAERARRAAYLPQSREIAWPLSVEDLISLGRIPWPGGRRSVADGIAVGNALRRMKLEPFRHRTALQLSGGEQARVLIARALAQETPLIIADEPASGLDPAQQLVCMRLFQQLTGEGKGLLVSLHDLGLAARFCHRLVLLAEGRVQADGPPRQVLQDEAIRRAFGITLRQIDTPDGPAVIPV